jgi:glycerol-3-phosphate dehydrogenase
MHDDARTNLSIAQSAAKEGADIVNYCEVVKLIRENDSNVKNVKSNNVNSKNNFHNNNNDISINNNENNKIIGAIVKDITTNKEFSIFSKTVLFCGGPFTDDLRRLSDEKVEKVVSGSSGIHIVLPSYYAPSGIGLVDMSTSDGRFILF